MCDIERDGRPKFEQAASAGHDKSSTARPDSGVRDPGLGTSGRSWARREPARAGDSGAGDSCPCEVSGLFRHFPSGFPEHAMVLQRELCAISTARRVAGNSRVSRIRIGILREGEQRHGVGRCRLAPGPDKGGLGSSLPCCVGHCCCSFSPSLWSRHIRLLRPNFRWREQACRCTLLLARGDARLLRLAAATPSGRDTDAGAGGYRNLVCWRDGLPDCHQRDARAGAA